MAVNGFFLTALPDPEGQEVQVDELTYDVVRGVILEILRVHGSMTFTRLGELVEDQLREDFDGSVMWYFTAVKMEMEARGELRRVPNSRPQVVELCMQ